MRTSALFRALIVAVVVLAGGLAFTNQQAVGNQQGPGVNERTENLIGLCRLNFGIEDVTTTRTPGAGLAGAKVACIGGPLDGLTCYISKNATVCDWKTVGAESQSPGSVQEVTTVNQDLIFVSELPADSLSPLTPAAADQPMLVEAVITWNPSAEAVAAAGIEQVNGCRQLGGEEVVTHADGDPQSASFTVQCEGGLLDDQWCAFGTGSSTCFFLPESTPVETTDAMPTVAIAPTSADVMDPTEPSATTEPTAPAPTATVVPTDVPVIEPTAPAVEPTLPVFEEDPTPTPTPVILT